MDFLQSNGIAEIGRNSLNAAFQISVDALIMELNAFKLNLFEKTVHLQHNDKRTTEGTSR
jgi:hypothetical protein